MSHHALLWELVDETKNLFNIMNMENFGHPVEVTDAEMNFVMDEYIKNLNSWSERNPILIEDSDDEIEISDTNSESSHSDTSTQAEESSSESDDYSERDIDGE